MEGHDVKAAEDGERGLAMAHEHRPALIICDLMMPKMDGHGVLEAVRADDDLSATPFIFLTARADKRDVRAGMTRGADDYLTKPFKLTDILAAVKAQLQKHQAFTERADARVVELRRTLSQSLPHEFRTPLSSVLALSQIMLEMEEEMKASERRQMLEDIHGSAKRLERLVENYVLFADLELAMAEEGHRLQSYPARPLALAKTVREAVESTAAMAGRTSDLQLEIEEATVAIAPQYLRKLVCELVDNACKFSEAGDHVRVTLRAAREGAAEVRLEIANQGIGISTDEIARLEAFRQIGREQHEQQGMGLGLAIVDRLCRVYGGSLSLSSTPGEWTRALISLPAYIPANASTAPQA